MENNHSIATNSVNRLIHELSKLPGIGPKSAQRLTFHLLRTPDDQAGNLAEAILSLRHKTQLCVSCFNIADGPLCLVCGNNKRDKTIICVVEQPQDILAIEHVGIYKGLYHVLHGAISPTEGIGFEDIKIKELVERLKHDQIREIIIATNPTLEGEQTSMYLNKIISSQGIKVTRLARGLPFGTELEYADDFTLSRALEGRQEL
jgi:recombination protein RecR